jgi:hypothetical protein
MNNEVIFYQSRRGLRGAGTRRAARRMAAAARGGAGDPFSIERVPIVAHVSALPAVCQLQQTPPTIRTVPVGPRQNRCASARANWHRRGGGPAIGGSA